MRYFHLSGACALAFALLLFAPAAVSAREIAGPQLDAAALRGARQAAPEPLVRLDFELHRGEAAPTPLTALIAADYVDIIESGRETLYDFRLRRRLDIDRANGTFASFSLYGDVAARRFQLYKGVELGRVFAAESHQPELPLPLQRFWLESDVGLAVGAKPLPITQQKTADGARRYRYEGKDVGFFQPSHYAVPATLQRSFERFLRLQLPIHPDILAVITLDGRLPQRLIVIGLVDGERVPLGLVLKSAGRLEADYPLPAKFALRPLAGEATDAEALSLRRLLPTMVDAVSGRTGLAPRSLAEYRHAADQALGQGRGFAAMLLVSEAALQYGPIAGDCASGLGWAARCQRGDELNRVLANDPRAALFYKVQTARSRDPAAVVAELQGLKRDDVADGYVVDAFLADRLSAAGKRQEAMGAFALALAGNPYLAGVYKELGDHYLRAARSDLAWICYDLGRSLPGRRSDDALAAVDAMEDQLAATYPAFF
jgi:hypothetical protein